MKVDLDKMGRCFFKNVSFIVLAYQRVKYRGIFRIISRPRIFDVSNRCFRRYIPVILFWTLSWNICLRFEICKTFKLSAMQFSRRRYLLCRRCHYVFFLHFSRSVVTVIFIPPRLLVVRIIDSVCYRPTFSLHASNLIYLQKLVVSRFNSWSDLFVKYYSSNYSNWSEWPTVTELRHDPP